MSFAQTHTRAFDPQTSFSAAAKAGRSSQSIKQRVLTTLRQSGEPMTSWDIARCLELRPDQVWKRISDLSSEGFIEPVDFEVNDYGNIAHAWTAEAPNA